MNPIRKFTSRGGTYTVNGFKPLRLWGFECDCGKSGAVGNGWHNTRKRAKDALYWHRKNECPARALEGCLGP